jgi:hypothetical protein
MNKTEITFLLLTLITIGAVLFVGDICISTREECLNYSKSCDYKFNGSFLLNISINDSFLNNTKFYYK